MFYITVSSGRGSDLCKAGGLEMLSKCSRLLSVVKCIGLAVLKPSHGRSPQLCKELKRTDQPRQPVPWGSSQLCQSQVCSSSDLRTNVCTSPEPGSKHSMPHEHLTSVLRAS